MNSLPIRSVDTSMYEVPNVMLCLGVRLGYAEWPLISESSNTTERALEKKKKTSCCSYDRRPYCVLDITRSSLILRADSCRCHHTLLSLSTGFLFITLKQAGLEVRDPPASLPLECRD